MRNIPLQEMVCTTLLALTSLLNKYQPDWILSFLFLESISTLKNSFNAYDRIYTRLDF
jgi:hypothetical protein